MPEPSTRDAEIPALTEATENLRIALRALEIAKTQHASDAYLQGQARERVWQCYWDLRKAAGDA